MTHGAFLYFFHWERASFTFELNIRSFRASQHQSPLASITNEFRWLWRPMIFGNGQGQSFPNICLTIEENPQKNWPNQESNLGPLGERQRYYSSTTALVSFSFNLVYYYRPIVFPGNTGLPKYYVRLQTAVVRGFGLPAGWLAGHHTDAAPKHSLCYFSSVFE